ncbi:MAG: hypothetical protein JST16_19215 [Bdellovibrionales bacterium]|nr:hypothetical protein [Bdellovibrionales bacterium]
MKISKITCLVAVLSTGISQAGQRKVASAGIECQSDLYTITIPVGAADTLRGDIDLSSSADPVDNAKFSKARVAGFWLSKNHLFVRVVDKDSNYNVLLIETDMRDGEYVGQVSYAAEARASKQFNTENVKCVR